MPSKSEIVIRDATIADVESLTTMVPRSWAPEAFLNQIFKDGPTIRQWWAEVHTRAIQDPTYRILVAVDGPLVVGVLTLGLWRKTAAQPEAPGGLCTLVPLTDDHDALLQEALVEQLTERRKYMGEHPNFLVDLLGVDAAYQKLGIGARLVKLGCGIADEEQAAIFLETTAAREFYVKLGMGFEDVKQFNEHGAGGVIIRQPK